MTTPAVRLTDEAAKLRQHADDHMAAADALVRLPKALAELDATQVALTEAEAKANRLTGMVAERDVTVADLTRRLADCQTGQEPGPPTITLGAAVNLPDNSFASFRAAEQKVGVPLRVDRTFSTGVTLPQTAKDALAAGVSVYHSIRPPLNPTTADDQAILGVAASLAAVPGSALLAHHEPENPNKTTTAAAFQSVHRHVYRLVKAQHPNLDVGYASMSYHYRPGGVAVAGGWIIPDEFTDFHGVDDYRGASAYEPLGPIEANNQFGGWWKLVQGMIKPKRVIEYGIRADDRNFMAGVIRSDHAWLSAHGFDTVLLWLGTGDAGDWAAGLLSPPVVQAIRETYGMPN